jgi:glycosyltransferase involved in cell wall biosynthesis
MQSDKFLSQLRSKRIIVSTHVYGTGASQDLVRYLVDKKITQVLYIGHPLFYDTRLRGSGYELYIKGKKIKEKYTPHRKIPLLVSFIVHASKSFVWSLSQGKTWDLYVGSNNVNAFVGLMLKKIGVVAKVVYYVIDFNPTRYENPMLNYLYHALDQYCVTNADETWNLSPRMQQGREKYFHFFGGRQRVIPVGIWRDSLAANPFTTVRKHTLVFLGHILQKQGIGHVISAIPIIREQIRDFEFLVIGGGEYLDTLRQQVAKLKIGKHVRFTDYVEDHREIDKMLSHCALAVALYEKYDGKNLNFTYFAEPTKLKSYLSQGLPVLLSNVPYNAKEIEDHNCGKIITNNPQSIAKEVVSIFNNTETLRDMRKNVIIYRKQFDWERIFNQALSSLV